MRSKECRTTAAAFGMRHTRTTALLAVILSACGGGGGGNDTLIGGSGDDVIGFNSIGDYTVEIDGADKLAFQFDGINTIEDLLPFVTGVSEADGNVTYEFLNGEASITLVGMTADEVTADMVIFNL